MPIVIVVLLSAYKTAFRNRCRYLECLPDAISLVDNCISEIFCLCCTTCDIRHRPKSLELAQFFQCLVLNLKLYFFWYSPLSVLTFYFLVSVLVISTFLTLCLVSCKSCFFCFFTFVKHSKMYYVKSI